MKVIFSENFYKYYQHFPEKDQIKIREFVNHLENFGFNGLAGRNKSSNNVPTNDPNWLAKVKYAQKYRLWHYHIGIPNYETTSSGEQVSEYILHYQRFDDEIRLVAMSYHPPFELPNEQLLLLNTTPNN